MNAPTSVSDLKDEEIRAWLKRAIEGTESLPRLTPDESPAGAIYRLDKSLKPPARDSLRDACLYWVRQFCENRNGSADYVEELLSLTARFKIPEAVEALSRLVQSDADFQPIPLPIRLAVISVLADTPPPRTPEFWKQLLKRDRNYSSLAFAGMLTAYPWAAIEMLPELPNNERLGQTAALNLELTWDLLEPRERSRFVEAVDSVLGQCGDQLSPPVREWTAAKQPKRVLLPLSKLKAALIGLGPEYEARHYSPRLAA